MRHILIIFSFLLLLSSPLFGQSERPETIIIPVSGIGDVSNTRKLILGNTLIESLSQYFRLVPQDKFEEVQEKVFEELDYEECTEDQCIVRIQEMLQVENVFHLQVIGEGKDTQMSLKWVGLYDKRVKTDYCENCGTKELNQKVNGLVESLVNEMDGVKTDVKVEPTIEIERKVIQKPKEVEKTISEPLNIRIRGLYGSVQSGETSVTNLSYLVIWNKFGFGQTQLTYKTKSSSGDEFDVSNSTLDFSYTIMEEWNVTIGVGFVSQGQGSITSSNKEYTSTDVSGNGLFIIGGFDLDKLEITGGLRRNSFEFKGFKSDSTNHSVSGIQLIFGVGWSF